MPTITLNGRPYAVQEGECPQKHIEEFCNLKMYPELGKAERLVGLLCDIAEDVFHEKITLEIHGWRNGGFIPLECARRGHRVRVISTESSPQILFPVPEDFEIVTRPWPQQTAQLLFVEEGFQLSHPYWTREVFLLAPAGALTNNHVRYPLQESNYELLVPSSYLTKFCNSFHLKKS